MFTDACKKCGAGLRERDSKCRLCGQEAPRSGRNSGGGVASFAAAPPRPAVLPTAVSPALAAQQAEKPKVERRGRSRKAATEEPVALTLDELAPTPETEVTPLAAEAEPAAELVAAASSELASVDEPATEEGASAAPGESVA